MKVTVIFEIPETTADIIQATLDYFDLEDGRKGICCAEVFSKEIKTCNNLSLNE